MGLVLYPAAVGSWDTNQLRLNQLYMFVEIIFFKNPGKFRSYQRTGIHWILNAKQDATRLPRLEELIADSDLNQKLKPFRYAAN
jgi:hypothetical protein